MYATFLRTRRSYFITIFVLLMIVYLNFYIVSVRTSLSTDKYFAIYATLQKCPLLLVWPIDLKHNRAVFVTSSVTALAVCIGNIILFPQTSYLNCSSVHSVFSVLSQIYWLKHSIHISIPFHFLHNVIFILQHISVNRQRIMKTKLTDVLHSMKWLMSSNHCMLHQK